MSPTCGSWPTRTTLRLAGTVPPEVWNRLGTRIIPRLGGHRDVLVSVAFELTTSAAEAEAVKAELAQVIGDLDLAARLRLSEKPSGGGDA